MVSSPPLLIIGEHRAHFLDLPKDNHIRRGVPAQWITATRRDRRPACPLVDRGRGMAYPIFGAGVSRSFPWRKSQRTHRLAPRIMLRGRPLFHCEEENLLSYTTRKKGANGDAD